ncbi:formin-binding protein [Coemansia guatemalensis]|uniref:Formin-binding protein n=1 Tax=Coemansia guatemalensis TaxID=2761395 RepID=A0A9W8I3C8_9FUNG|nr:formin-binding protein [Coemansia guatemalensis]
MKYNFVFSKLGRDSGSGGSGAGDDAGGATPVSPRSPSGPLSNKGSGIPHGTTKSTAGASVADTTSEMPADFVCSERFADNFWSTDERCISVLMHKLKSAKQTCTDVLQMVATRASLEEDLGKRLNKLSRSGLGSEEVGGIKDALRTMRAEMETNAKAHLDLAKQLRAEIEKPLSTFIADQRTKRRAQTTVIQKTEADRNTLRSQVRKLQDKRRSDTKKVGDLELQANGLQGMGDPKLRTKLERAQAQQRSTESEYVDVRKRLKEADQQWFNVWRSACDVFQVLEEERVEYLKTVLWSYTNLVSSCCVTDDESMERIRQDLEKIDVASDIAAFIQNFGTGSPDPELAKAAGVGDSNSDTVSRNKQQHNRNGSDTEDTVRDDRSTRGHSQGNSYQNAGATGSAIPAPSATSSSPYGIPQASNTMNSVSTSGTARSGSILAHPVSRPQTQESFRAHSQQQQQQQRPASLHSAAGGVAAPPMQQHMVNGSPNWPGRPTSSMQQGHPTDNGYRRASNNDMYAMAGAGQMPPQQQYIQRTNSQAGMRPADQPPTYVGAANGMYGNVVDPRAPSSMGVYRGAGTSSPVMAPLPPQQQQQRSATPNQMSDMNGAYPMQHPPRMGSPRSRASTYNGPQAHTGHFGTLTANAQMHPSPQQPFAGGGHQPNSAPGSPYQQPIGNSGSRPVSAAGMHSGSPSGMPGMGNVGARPVSAMQNSHYAMAAGPPPPQAASAAAYRSNTPVQQSPQYMANPMSRPPTQMSHSPVPQMHPQMAPAAAPSPQMHQRAPSVMSGGYAMPPQMMQPQQQRPMSRVEQNNSVTESGKEILFYVKVLYDYDAENDKELSIKEGDVISVLAVSADGWWEGEMTDRRTGRPIQGTFPSNFTDPIANLISH